MNSNIEQLKEILLRIYPSKVSYENGYYKVIISPTLFFYIKKLHNEYETLVASGDGKQWLFCEFTKDDLDQIYKSVIYAHDSYAISYIGINLPNNNQRRLYLDEP